MKVNFGMALRAVGTQKEINELVESEMKRNKVITYSLKPSTINDNFQLNMVTGDNIGGFYGKVLSPKSGNHINETLKQEDTDRKLQGIDGINENLEDSNPGFVAPLLRYITSVFSDY